MTALSFIAIACAGQTARAQQAAAMFSPGEVRAGTKLVEPLDPPAQTGDDAFWQVTETVKLSHQARGTGRNVLLVHGGPGYPFRGALPALAPLHGDYTFHYYAQRGCPPSTVPDWRAGLSATDAEARAASLEKHLGLGAHIADIERIRRILGDEKLILIGHSFGGVIASMYAAEFPERVEAMILVAPAGVVVMPDAESDLFAIMRERLHEDDRAGYDAFVKTFMNLTASSLLTDAEAKQRNADFGMYYVTALGGERFAPAPEQFAQMAAGFITQAMYLSLGEKHDWRPALAKVKAPVLILHGDQDMIPLASSKQYASALPHARVEIIAGGDHGMLASTEDAIALELSRFLHRLRAK